MPTLAVLPVKRFSAAKQRLAPGLSPEARAALAEAMLADVLAAATAAAAIDSVAVVTAEPRAKRLAHAAGALVLRDPQETGQSPAAAAGVAHALSTGFDRLLLIPGDTPLVSAVKLDALLARAAGRRLGAAVVADRHGTGTNALVLSPPDLIEPSFGPGSLARHLAAARAASAPHALESMPELEHDVDTPADLDAVRELLAAAPQVVGPRTRAALAELALAMSEGERRGREGTHGRLVAGAAAFGTDR